MVNDDDLVVNIVIGFIMVIMLFIGIWSIVAILPSVNSHTHSKVCYTEQGTLVCGKEDGELYLSQSHIPTVLDVLTYFEDKKSAEWENLTPIERMWSDRYILGFLVLLLIGTIIYSRKKDNKQDEVDKTRI